MHNLFGTKHLIILAICLVLIPVAYFFARKLKYEKMIKLMLYIGIISETIKIFYFTITNEDKLFGVLPKSDLPFHLCSIQILFIIVLNVSQNKKLKDMLISFMMPSCLIGAFMALLIATDSSRNGSIIITIQYFTYHMALIVFALYLMTSKEQKPTFKSYTSCLKMLLILMFFAFYINSLVYDGSVIGNGEDKINFMYVAGPPQKGLPFLNEDNGWLSYICRYALIIITAITLFYIKPIVLAVKEKIGAVKKGAEVAADIEQALEKAEDTVEETENV